MKNGRGLRNTPEKPKTGLSSRYLVVDIRTGRTVKDAFVLIPSIDVAARDALRVYALQTKNESLAEHLLKYLETMRQSRKFTRKDRRRHNEPEFQKEGE